MRLSQWRSTAPVRDALGPKVAAVLNPVVGALGGEKDPHAWVAWGDDPGIRYVVLVPTPAGLAYCHVRANIPGEGPRVSAKLVRWSRVQLGELGFETQAGHRLVSFQVEGQVLRGADDEADRIAAFALAVMSAMDGRPMPDLEVTDSRSAVVRARGHAGTNGGVTRRRPPGAGPPSGLAPARPPSARRTSTPGRPSASG